MVQFSSATQLRPTLCDPMDCSTSGFPVHHRLPELDQSHVHRVGDAIQSSHPLPTIFPSTRVVSNESVLHISWPKYWSFSFSIGPSNEYSVLISFRIDWSDFLAVQETLKSLLQHHSSKASILWRSAFFIVQLSHPYIKWSAVKVPQSCPTLCNPTDNKVHGILQARILEWVAFPFSRGSSQPRDRTQGSNPALPHCRRILYQLSHKGSPSMTTSHPYMTPGKTKALTSRTFVSKVMSLLFNMLSRLVIAFLPRSKHLLILWLQSPSAVILEPKKIKSVTVSIFFPIYLPWNDGTRCNNLSFLNVEF